MGDAAHPYLTHVSFIPALTVIFLTLIDKNTEDVKWFTFNIAVIVIINSVLYETKDIVYEKFLQNLDKNSPILHIWFIGEDVTQCPIFMLAVTRAFILYWPDTYKKFVSRFLFLWIIAGDILLVFLLFLSSEISTGLQIYDRDVSKFLNTTFHLVLLILTFSCSFSVLYQIQKMAQEVAHNTQLAVYDALRRASFYLSYYSEYFTKMFQSEFKEGREGEVELEEIEYEEMLQLLCVIYPSNAPITDKNLEIILKLADRFIMPAVLKQCKKQLRTSTLNGAQKLFLAQQYNFKDLLKELAQQCKTIEDVKKLKSEPEYELLDCTTHSLILDSITS